MLKLITLIVFIFSFSVLASDEMELKLLKLEKRIKQLEKEKGLSGNGLKTQDYKQKSVAAPGQSASASAQLSPEEQKNLMEQINTIKKSQEEQKKLLEEIMNED